jgi:hypothetical protein
MIWLSFFITFVFIMTTAWIDSSHINNGQHFKSHTSRFIQRCCFFASQCFLGWESGLASVLLFIALFDGVLNIMMNRPLFHLGNTARWDKFFRDQPGMFFFVKVGSLIGSILLYRYAYHM